jgi:hypothetical protein
MEGHSMQDFQDSVGGTAAGVLHDALLDSADALQNKSPSMRLDRRTTLLIVAGTCFLLGFLWAKARQPQSESVGVP